MQHVSLDVILQLVFGVQAPERMAAFRRAVQLAVSEVNPAPLFFRFLQRELGGFGPWARFLRLLRALDELIYAQIAEARRAPAGRTDVLARMLEARTEDGEALSDRDLRDQLLTLLVAGHETTAITLAWAFYELARDPALLERLRDEIAPSDPTRAPTPSPACRCSRRSAARPCARTRCWPSSSGR